MSELLFDPETLDAKTIEKLRKLESFIINWNKNINIVSANNTNQVWNRHIVDSLQIIPFLNDINKLADMGTGIGLPSIPLAIACPEVSIFAIEPNRKKTILISELLRELSISNFHLSPDRVESVIISHVDVVCCRAFGEFKRDALLAYKMLKPGGKFITYKATEEKESPKGFSNTISHPYRLPNYPKEFQIIVTEKNKEID